MSDDITPAPAPAPDEDSGNVLTDALPAKARKYVYWAFALAGVVLAVLQICEVNTGKAPEVLAYLGIAFGALAGSNVRHTPPAL